MSQYEDDGERRGSALGFLLLWCWLAVVAIGAAFWFM